MNYLNETKVLNFYLEEIERDNISFLKGREKYKELLKKNITKLRDEEQMHHKIEIAKDLWKVLFEASMSYIDPDKRGYDQLFEYFDKYVAFEELIFASDSFYRDHTLHCLWVYFLGEYIKRNKKFEFLFHSYEKVFAEMAHMKQAFENSSIKEYFEKFLKILGDYELVLKKYESIRCVSALCHDLGYPLKKVSKINKSIKEILPYFALNNYDEFNFDYTNLQEKFIDDFLKFMSSDFTTEFSGENKKEGEILMKIFITENKKLISLNEEYISTLSDEEKEAIEKVLRLETNLIYDESSHMRYACDFEEYSHGIMSSFLLAKIIHSFKNIKYSIKATGEIYNSEFDLTGYLTMQSILKAMADHTNNSYQISSFKDNSAFLILIDELEEFSRISRANKNREFIIEFCKTDIYNEENIFCIDFIFNNEKIENLDPEKAFKGRCKRFLSTFNIRDFSEDFKIRLRCIGDLSYDKNIYTLEIGKKYANILINDIEQDIPKYLKSNQFYAKEEYMSM